MVINLKKNIAPVPLLDSPDGLRLYEPAEPGFRRAAGKSRIGYKKFLTFSVMLLLTAAVTGISASAAQAPGGTLNDIVTTLFGENTQTVDIIILLTILTLLPSIVLMMTGFTRILIVLSFMRQALGMQQTPPNQVLIGLALFLTLYVMSPVVTIVYNDAYIPFTNQEIDQEEFIERAMEPTREFMMNQIYTSDMDFFLALSKEPIEDLESIPNKIVIPAFLTSEIKRAFQIGFLIYVPFIVIDMVVASTLMAMGMMMLPPAMLSLPFKVLLFVLVDGWQLILGSLIRTFR